MLRAALLALGLLLLAGGCAEDAAPTGSATTDAPWASPSDSEDAAPGASTDPTPTADPEDEAADEAAVDAAAERYVTALAARGAKPVRRAADTAVPGSTADAYLAVQLLEELAEDSGNLDWLPVERVRELRRGAFELCLDDDCDRFDGFRGTNGQVETLRLEGQTLDDRFTGASEPVEVPALGTARVVATYRSPLSKGLRVYVEVSSEQYGIAPTDELVVYRDPASGDRLRATLAKGGNADPYTTAYARVDFPTELVGGTVSLSFCTYEGFCPQVDLPTEPLDTTLPSASDF